MELIWRFSRETLHRYSCKSLFCRCVGNLGSGPRRLALTYNVPLCTRNGTSTAQEAFLIPVRSLVFVWPLHSCRRRRTTRMSLPTLPSCRPRSRSRSAIWICTKASSQRFCVSGMVDRETFVALDDTEVGMKSNTADVGINLSMEAWFTSVRWRK